MFREIYQKPFQKMGKTEILRITCNEYDVICMLQIFFLISPYGRKPRYEMSRGVKQKAQQYAEYEN